MTDRAPVEVTNLDRYGSPALPWSRPRDLLNCTLLEKLDDQERRTWNALQTIAQGWSRNVLIHQIDSGLYERQGRALTNFDRTLE